MIKYNNELEYHELTTYIKIHFPELDENNSFFREKIYKSAGFKFHMLDINWNEFIRQIKKSLGL